MRKFALFTLSEEHGENEQIEPFAVNFKQFSHAFKANAVGTVSEVSFFPLNLAHKFNYDSRNFVYC